VGVEASSRGISSLSEGCEPCSVDLKRRARWWACFRFSLEECGVSSSRLDDAAPATGLHPSCD